MQQKNSHPSLARSLYIHKSLMAEVSLCVPVILKRVVVDVFGGKLADVGMHAILHAEEEDGRWLWIRLMEAFI